MPCPTCSAPPIPQGPCPVCPRLAQEFEPWRQAAYYKAMLTAPWPARPSSKTEIAALQAQLRLREQQLFGRKADSTATAEGSARPTPSPRPRGQQPGKPGPRRRITPICPPWSRSIELPAEQQCCSRCGQPFASFPGTEDTTVLEIDVRAHRRIYRRRRYRPTCSCGHHAGIVTAPPPARVIPKSILGVSVWVTVLLDKFLFYRPTYRLLEDLGTQGLDLSQGTLTDGLQRLLPLFEPLYDHLVEHSQQQTLWHADETRWLVFATFEGKVGHRWYLWVFHAAEVVVFVLSPGRSHEVPEEHFGPVEEGILVVDRYAAYQAMAQVKDGTIVLAFCWAHKMANILDKLPKGSRPGGQADAPRHRPGRGQGQGREGVRSVREDLRGEVPEGGGVPAQGSGGAAELFYEFPAEHRVHRLMGSASKGWRSLNGSPLLAEVVRGIRLIDGIREKPAA